MSFPVYINDGVYVISDSSKVKGKQAAIEAENKLKIASGTAAGIEVPKGYKGPICPKCGDYRVRQLSAVREAAECLEPTHRAAIGVKMLPALYACPCGKRWEASAASVGGTYST